jgi:hypothetical protein
MAVIRGFEKATRKPRTHPTEVICHWAILSDERGPRLIQLDTHGSKDRENPGKLSQTLQLKRDGARQLVEILRREFGI